VTDDEILARIANDVVDVGNTMFGVRDITIWITKDLFNRLCPELQNDAGMATLFGCRIRVVLLPCDGVRWIVGYEGTAEEGK